VYRPARCAVFINIDDPDGMATCLRVIEWATSMWGGWNTCIIPTNGETIAEPFWKLLQAFDPDYLFTYRKTLLDIKLGHPEKFEEYVQRRLDQTLAQHPNANPEHVRKQTEENTKVKVDHFELNVELYHDLVKRLNPFSGGARDIQRGITAQPLKGVYSLTSLCELPDLLSSPVEVTNIDINASPLVQMIRRPIDGFHNVRTVGSSG
jgi:hypothetical protein